ncbi:MAG: SagB/ThcOx family dehydrogenase [Prevotellaceae bacterium]|jgi:SagB-type dehydrogenase family enzyme|nr:SagB/ThcOx family dehydrogenase [Prevotellaceae bacterium]
MKKMTLCAVALIASAAAFGQNIALPAPQKSGGKPLMEALSQRQSARQFDVKALSEQTLSNLLWAAYGFNREGMRTAPSANNKQEFEIYVALEKGLYLYNAKDNALELVKKEDLRSKTGGQNFVGVAPLNLVYVYDTQKMKDEKMAYADCGFISQNVYLYCASEGLATVVRGYVNKEDLAKAIGLKPEYAITLSQTVGYPQK